MKRFDLWFRGEDVDDYERKRGKYKESKGLMVCGRWVGDVCIYVYGGRNYSGMDKTNLYDINGNNVRKKQKRRTCRASKWGGHKQVMCNHQGGFKRGIYKAKHSVFIILKLN